MSKPNGLKLSKLCSVRGSGSLNARTRVVPAIGFVLPAGIDLEVADRGGHRGVAAIIQDHQPARAHELTQVEQVEKHVVKDVAAIHKRCVGDKAITQEGKRDLGSFLNERTEVGQRHVCACGAAVAACEKSARPPHGEPVWIESRKRGVLRRLRRVTAGLGSQFDAAGPTG